MTLKEKVREKGLTLNQMCELFRAAGLYTTTHPSVRKLLNNPGRMTIDHLVVFSDVFDLSVKTLAGLIIEELEERTIK